MSMIFGDYPIDPVDLVFQLNKRATQVARQLDPLERNTAFTLAIKMALAEMATTHGCRPFYTQPGDKISEFMLDMVWWREDESGAAAMLGVECEWGNPRERNCERRAGCVADDFEKLLQFKAPLKLMIFTADNREMRFAIHTVLQRYMTRFRQHLQGERYVFADFSAGKCFSYETRVTRDGQDDSFRLIPLTPESASALHDD